MSEDSPKPGAFHEDLIEHGHRRAPSANPFASSANITVSVPETVEIRLVDATTLSDYEVWSLLTSILSSAVVGFLVAYFQAQQAGDRHTFLAIVLVFAVLMLVCALTANAKRHRLRARSRRVRFQIGEAIPDSTDESSA